LHEGGHVGNGKNKTAQHEEWQNEKECRHHGLLLCGRDGGNEKTDPESAQKEDAGGKEEKEDASGQGDLKPENGDDCHPDHLRDRNDDIRNRLPHDEFDGHERGDDELFHRSRLLFLDNGDRGQKQRDQHDDKGDNPGNKEVLAVKVRIVPGPDSPVDFPVIHLERVQLPQQIPIQFFKNHHGIGHPDRGHIAHAAVGKDLDFGRFALFDLPAQIGCDLDSEINLSD